MLNKRDFELMKRYKMDINDFFQSKDNFVKKIVFGIVSINPPLLETIVAQPLEADSTAVLPNGCSHTEGTTDMLVSLYKSKVLL